MSFVSAAQCEYEIAERRPSPNEPSQSIEHLDQNDESRTFLDCVQWVIDEIPNAQALFWDEQGKCIGYVTFEEDLEYMGNVNSRFCVLPPREINFDGENTLFVSTSSVTLKYLVRLKSSRVFSSYFVKYIAEELCDRLAIKTLLKRNSFCSFQKQYIIKANQW